MIVLTLAGEAGSGKSSIHRQIAATLIEYTKARKEFPVLVREVQTDREPVPAQYAEWASGFGNVPIPDADMTLYIKGRVYYSLTDSAIPEIMRKEEEMETKR